MAVGVNLLHRPRTVRVWRRHFVRTFPSPGRHTAARSSFPAMFFAMIEVIKGAGPLIYPLAICSTAAVFIVCERAYALRRAAIMPQDLVDAVINGRPLMGGKHTVLARIVEFAEQHKNDEGAVKAFARLEINRMERGVPYLDVIYAAAPLIGLTGTVVGLDRKS